MRFPLLAQSALAAAALIWLAVGLPWLQGQDQKAARVDQDGEPLPQGALARLGTLKFVHLGHVAGVALSPDGKVVASGAHYGKQKLVYNPPPPGYVPEVFGHDANLAHWTEVGSIRLWDTSTGKLLREIETPAAPVSALAFDSTGKILFAGCGNYVCSFDVATGKKLWEQEAINSQNFAFHRAERILVSRDKVITLHDGYIRSALQAFEHRQKVIRCWDPKTGRPSREMLALESSVDTPFHINVLFHEVAFSPDAKFAAVVRSKAEPQPEEPNKHTEKWHYSRQRMQIVEIKTGQVIHSFANVKSSFSALAFSEDSQTLAVATEKDIELIQTKSGQKRNLVNNPGKGIRQLRFIDKDRIAAELRDNVIRVWNVTDGTAVHAHSITTHSFATAQIGKIAAVPQGNTVGLIDLESGKPMHSFEGHRWTPAVGYAINAKSTLLSRDAQQGFQWHTSTWQIKKSVTFPRDAWQSYRFENHPDIGFIASTEKHVYLKVHQKSQEVREIANDRLISRLDDRGEKLNYAQFSAAGNRLMTVGSELFQFFDVSTGALLSIVPRWNVHFLGYNCEPQFSSKGTYFAKNDGHRGIQVFDVKNGKELCKLVPRLAVEGLRFSILPFVFSSDEKFILGEVHEGNEYEGKRDGEKVSLALWDVSNGKVVHQFVLWPSVGVFFRNAFNEPKIKHMRLSPDLRSIALTEPDGKTIQIWDIASGTQRGEFSGHYGTVADLAFSPDGRQLASSSDDTTILIWDMHRPFQAGNFKKRLGAAELTAHWETLFLPDARKADAAIWSLIHADKDSVPFLKKQVTPAPRPDAKWVQLLLDDLDSNNYKARSKAQVELEGLGELILPALEKALTASNGPEKLERLKGIVQKARYAALPFGAAKRMQQLRALEVLEKIASAEARQLVKQLAEGNPSAQFTIAARAVLTRMEAARSGPA